MDRKMGQEQRENTRRKWKRQESRSIDAMSSEKRLPSLGQEEREGERERDYKDTHKVGLMIKNIYYFFKKEL